MLDLDQLRSRQEQRLIPALESWNLAKKHLEEAIALCEAREREFQQVSEDVKRRIDALQLVATMANELQAPASADRSLPPAPQPMLAAPPKPGPGVEMVAKPEAQPPIQMSAPKFAEMKMPVRRSWRPLFPSLHRSDGI